MLLSPGSADQVSKIRVKNREPVPSYRMDRNDDEIDAMMVSRNISVLMLFSIILVWPYYDLGRSLGDSDASQ